MNRELMTQIHAAKYISLATRRRNGEFVPTPVWFVSRDNAYYVFSAGNKGKVKRLHNFSDARIAPCTVTGKLTGGWIKAEARLIQDPKEVQVALTALRQKYGWQMCLLDCLARLGRRLHRRAYIRVVPQTTLDQGSLLE